MAQKARLALGAHPGWDGPDLGGFLAILPFFGLWMLSLGLILLADDLPHSATARSRARLARGAPAELVRRRGARRGN